MSPIHGLMFRTKPPVRFLMLVGAALFGWILFATPRTNQRPESPWRLQSDAANAGEEQRLSRAELRDAFVQHRKEWKLSSRGGGDRCVFNVHHLGNALHAYRFDHTTYPSELKELVPDYIAFLPSCPTRGRDTYSAGYGVSAYRYRFELRCPDCDPKGTDSFNSAKPVSEKYFDI